MPTCWRSSNRHRPRRPEGVPGALLRLLVAALTLTGLAPLAAAQSLGEAAAREQERRAREAAKASPAVPAFTESDLEKARIAREGPPKPSPSPGAKGAASPKPSPSATPRPEPTIAPTPSQESYWRNRAQQKRKAIATAEAQIAALQQQLAALRNDLSPTGTGDPFRLQTQQAEMAKVSAALVEAEKELERAKQDLVDFEDEARRAGALPGWLREP